MYNNYFTQYESVNVDESLPNFELDPIRFELPSIRRQTPTSTTLKLTGNWTDNIHIIPNNSMSNPSQISVLQSEGYTPKNGDTVEINSDKNKKYGHTATYYNGKWYSDFKLENMNPYNDPNAKIRIFRNPNAEEAEKAAQLIASRAGDKTKHKCAQYVREGFDKVSGGKYKAEGYNGNNIGEYLLKRNWTQVARRGGILKALNGYKFVTYTASKPIVEPLDNTLFNLNLRIYELPIIKVQSTKSNVPTTPVSNWTNNIHLGAIIGGILPLIKVPTDKKGFLAHAKEIYKRNGLSENQAKIMAAQDALESGYGKHVSGTHNYGGVKGKGKSLDTTEVVNGKSVRVKSSFRNFNSYDDYAKYKINLLSGDKYKALTSDNVDDIISKIVKGGYATDPNYAKKLKSML